MDFRKGVQKLHQVDFQKHPCSVCLNLTSSHLAALGAGPSHPEWALCKCLLMAVRIRQMYNICRDIAHAVDTLKELPSRQWFHEQSRGQSRLSGREPAYQSKRCRYSGLIPGLRSSLGGGEDNPSSILSWKIPWIEEPGGLYSIRSQRVGHNWATERHVHTHGGQTLNMAPSPRPGVLLPVSGWDVWVVSNPYRTAEVVKVHTTGLQGACHAGASLLPA